MPSHQLVAYADLEVFSPVIGNRADMLNCFVHFVVVSERGIAFLAHRLNQEYGNKFIGA